MGEDDFDRQGLHGDLEVSRLVVPLEAVGTAVPGGGELAGPIEIQSPGKAVASGDVVEDLKAAEERLLRV